MRLIKFALKNLLIVVATLVLFSSLSWASPNEGAVKKCHKAVNGLLKEMSAKKIQTEFGALNQVKQSDVDQIVKDSNTKRDEFGNAQVVSAVGTMDLSNYFGKCKELLSKECVVEKPDAEDAAAAQEQMKGFIETCYANTSKNASQLASTVELTGKFKQGMSTMAKAATGAAALGGGYLLYDHISDKKEKKKEKKAEEEKYRADNGIIKDADGNDLQCFAQANFMKVECSEVMLGLCQGAKADTGGCRSFNSTYCASAGSGSNYCLYADAKTYCAQTGSVIAQSPACVWAGARSAECKKTPENVSCLYSGSAEALTLACQNFPNDPLCAAHSAGRIVVQGGNSAAETMAATTGDGTGDGAASGSSVSMSSVIDSAQSSTSGSGAGSNGSTLSANDSMWASSSTVAQTACAEGLLQNCD